jgi:hypothetical protein
LEARVGKKRAKQECDHEPVEVSRGGNGSTFWACPCGGHQWVSGADTGGKLVELTGKERRTFKREPEPEQPKKPAIPQHSSATNECFTPPEVAGAARRLMGGIDLDPASCAEANRTVQASWYFTEKVDGLTQMWDHGSLPSHVFLNPPGGVVRLGKTPFSSAAIWWAKLVQEWESGRVEQAVFVGFTLEILRLSQVGQKVPVQRFHRCYPRERLHFSGKDQPTHANVIVFLPPVTGAWMSTFRAFEEEFGFLGLCEPGWGLDRS